MRTLGWSLLCLWTACGGGGRVAPDDSGADDTVADDTPSPILDVAVSEERDLPGLTCPVHVVRVEGDIPHVYGHDRVDVARAVGFLYARDRFFTVELARRLSLGRIGALLGPLGAEIDVSSRLTGMTHVAGILEQGLTDDQREALDAYAEGVNAYVAAVRAETLPPPSELELAGPLLGGDPLALLEDLTRDDILAVLATLLYQLAFSDEDLDRSATAAALENLQYRAFDHEVELRVAGVREDLFRRWDPVFPEVSAEGFEVAKRPAGLTAPRVPASPALLRRTHDALGPLRAMLQATGPRGSNAWAVTGAHTAHGGAILAGDGHLPLTVPPLFWQLGIDTEELGSGGERQVGLGLPGVPTIAVGTNGHVAWSQTRLRGDVVDWYAETVQLGDDGAPVATRFQGDWRPLVVRPETIEVAAVLGGDGTPIAFDRYETFDGRFVVSVEGRAVDGPDDVGAGETAVRTLEGWVVPEQVDSEPGIQAISLDYTAFDPGAVIRAVEGFGAARDVDDFREATRFLQAYGQNLVVGDAGGRVLYTGYQGVPCRSYLDRDADGWADGADPTFVLDGTRYPGFTVPIDAEGRIDEGFPDDPTKCVVPFDAQPWATDPPSGFLKSANEDPGGHGLDGDLSNDRWYVGGPWAAGVRAHRITERLTALVEAGDIDVVAMARLQGDHQATTAPLLVPALLDAIDDARADGEGQAYDALANDETRLSEAAQRLGAWADRGYVAASGVATSYADVGGDDVADSVATMIFAAWRGALIDAVLDDEPLPGGVFQPSSSYGLVRTLHALVANRGSNDDDLAGWDPETGEHVLWDDRGTEEVDRSDTVMIRALSDALDALEAAPDGAGRGGFGTADPEAWRWGLRHGVRFDSLLGDYLGSNPAFGALLAPFAIGPDRIEQPGPAADLPFFPRPGDMMSVDAANGGFSVTDHAYGNGPVFRMVIALGPGGVSGLNVLPGGQSGLIDSDHFDDQAPLWLGNEALPLRFSVEDVVAGAVGREVYWPEGRTPCD